VLTFVMGWGLATSPAAAFAGAERFGAARFASEPQSYWWDSSGPVLLAQAQPADSNAGDGGDHSDTLGTPSSQPAPTPSPGTTVTPIAPANADSGSKAQMLPVTPGPSAPPETLRTTPSTTALPDSLRTKSTLPDSLRAKTAPAETLRATSAPPETLFAPTPHGVSPKPNVPATPPPKQHTGIWGVSPIAILLGLAVLHYFITKSVN